MDVLLVGGSGFIGTHLARELDEYGHTVTVLSRSPDLDSIGDGIRTVRGDVTDYDSIEGAFSGQDAVVNLVALSPLFTPDGGPEMHERVHLAGTEHVVRAAEEHDVSTLVQLSALGADPEGPTAYIRAKGRAEAVVRESHLDWVIVRPSVVFGDGGEFVAFTRLLTTPYVTGLPGGGKTRFQPIWVGDFVAMLAEAVTDDTHTGEVYELGGPEILTLADVTRRVYRADGKSVIVLPVPMALARVGLTLGEMIPGFPMGTEQYHSLRFDNTVTDNDVTAFGRVPEELQQLGTYLGVPTGGEDQSTGTGAALLAGVGAWVALTGTILLAGLASGVWDVSAVSPFLTGGFGDVGIVVLGTLLLVAGPVAVYARTGFVSPLLVLGLHFVLWLGFGFLSEFGAVRSLFIALLYWPYPLVAYCVVGGLEYVGRSVFRAWGHARGNDTDATE